MSQLENTDDVTDAAGSQATASDDPGTAPSEYKNWRDELFANDAAQLVGADSLGDQWSVPWADLMMAMFVLFAALLVAKMMNPDIEIRYKTQPVPELLEIERERRVELEVPTKNPSFEPLMRINVFDRSQDAIRETQLKNVEIALLKDQSVKVSVQGPMFFERGQAALRPQVTEFLDRLAIVIKQTPYQVHVVGHTDDNPINTAHFPSNWELSAVRASRVARYLISSASLEPSRFVVMGRAQYDPTHANEDDETRALNRRVEIVITRELSEDQNEED